MKLSKRLQAIADFVPLNAIVADIGTDHGYIPKYLIDMDISKVVVASDISYNSLEKTIEYVNNLAYARIIPRVGNGLETIKPFEVDTVILAGMGGLLIQEILDSDRDKTSSITNFILQPNIASKELRHYLMDHNFVIMDEDLVKEDGKYYEIIHAKKGKGCIKKDIYYEIGERLIEKRHPLLKEYIEFKIHSVHKIIETLKDKTTEKAMNRMNELKKKKESYQQVLEEL